MPSVMRCAIIGCPTTSRDRDGSRLRFFSFPSPHNSMYEKWLSQCHESAENILKQKKPIICSRHFQEKDMRKKHLVPGALPCLLLKVSPESIEAEKARLAEKLNRPRIKQLVSDAVLEWVKRAQAYPRLAGKCTTYRALQQIGERTRNLLGANGYLTTGSNWVQKFRCENKEVLEKGDPPTTQKSLEPKDIIRELDPDVKILSEEEIAALLRKELEMRRQNQKHRQNRKANSDEFDSNENSSSCDYSEDTMTDSFKDAAQIVKEELIIESDEYQSTNKSDIIDSLDVLLNADDDDGDMDSGEIAQNGVNIDSYQQALEYLKPLEDFALQLESHKLIGMLTTVQTLLKDSKE